MRIYFFLAFLFLLNSCVPEIHSSAQTPISPQSPLISSPTPTNPKIIRHVISGYNRSVWELRSNELDVFFETGSVEGIVRKKDGNACAFTIFALHDFPPPHNDAGQPTVNQIVINNNALFQRWSENENRIRGPLGYTQEELLFLFQKADTILASYYRLLPQPSSAYDIYEHTDPVGPYRILENNRRALREHCVMDDMPLLNLMEKISAPPL